MPSSSSMFISSWSTAYSEVGAMEPGAAPSGPGACSGPEAAGDLQYLEVELARPWEGDGNLQQDAGLGMTRWGFAGPGRGGGSAGPRRRGGWEGICRVRWEVMEVEDPEVGAMEVEDPEVGAMEVEDPEVGAMELEDPEVGGDGGGRIWKTTWVKIEERIQN
ncbi:uncharacterized protein LOC119275869 [Triticum dicoccoides]|uniref:uncharacterized protein LOC119275869 n=1 Tax=Triticum dicoccoides TaxID=85692 RepID=UPI000E786E30|nr:uncharacterized protein LOC119275869 [Triticum dicoccoides]XP_037412691.1 uncharacterized protein LOC119275869 [Triticum dicoccoides]XP_037412692.1 uncharacterized protein LOC119275869 [Triticum dicoccoides]XP_037412693.1 uncharacterized protein LOC119275869 [Triticum dicoccoides]